MMRLLPGRRLYWETHGGRLRFGLTWQDAYVGLTIFERGDWSLSVLPFTTIGYVSKRRWAENELSELRNPHCNCEQCAAHRRLARLTALAEGSEEPPAAPVG